MQWLKLTKPDGHLNYIPAESLVSVETETYFDTNTAELIELTRVISGNEYTATVTKCIEPPEVILKALGHTILDTSLRQ